MKVVKIGSADAVVHCRSAMTDGGVDDDGEGAVEDDGSGSCNTVNSVPLLTDSSVIVPVAAQVTRNSSLGKGMEDAGVLPSGDRQPTRDLSLDTCKNPPADDSKATSVPTGLTRKNSIVPLCERVARGQTHSLG